MSRGHLLARLEKAVGNYAHKKVLTRKPTEEVRDAEGKVFTGKMPTMALPENVDELLDQRRERMAGGNKLVRRNDIARWIVPEWRAKVLEVLDNAAKKSGEISEDIEGAVKAVREAAGGTKSVLSEADMKRLREFWKAARAMTIIQTLPQESGKLGGAVAQFALELMENYGPEALVEFEAMTELAGDLMMPTIQWQTAHGYVMDLDEWNDKGRPFLGARAPLGIAPTMGALGALKDEDGNELPFTMRGVPRTSDEAVEGLNDKQGTEGVKRRRGPEAPPVQTTTDVGPDAPRPEPAPVDAPAPGPVRVVMPATAQLPTTIEERNKQ